MKNFIVKSENAQYFETRFSADNAFVLNLENQKFFITDSRYTVEAKEAVCDNVIVVEADRGDLENTVAQILDEQNTEELFFDPKEFSVFNYENLKSKSKSILKPSPSLSHKRRLIKTPAEITTMKEVCKKARICFAKFGEFVKNEGIGQREQTLFFMAEQIFKDHGKNGLSFSPIVAINENAAKPHALPSEKILKENDLLLLDAGIVHKNFCSDRTVTVCVNAHLDINNRAQKFKNKKIQKAYDAVLFAHEKAIKEVRINMKACELDAICRNELTKRGYGDFFVHSTGHGVGLDVHEMPFISTANKQDILQNGMVFTIEPGVYFAKEFGIRIEEIVVLKNGVAEVL